MLSLVCFSCSKRTRKLFLLHLPFVFIWAWGINIIVNQGLQGEQVAHIGRINVNGWGVAALLLGLCALPGFGSLRLMSFVKYRLFHAPEDNSVLQW